MSADKVSFGTSDLEKIEVEVGSVVKVTYKGGVMESLSGTGQCNRLEAVR